MLVLTRKRNESIVIGDTIKLTIVEIRGDRVRVGIDAPDDVAIHRQEIWLAVQQEKQSSRQATDELRASAGV